MKKEGEDEEEGEEGKEEENEGGRGGGEGGGGEGEGGGGWHLAHEAKLLDEDRCDPWTPWAGLSDIDACATAFPLFAPRHPNECPVLL